RGQYATWRNLKQKNRILPDPLLACWIKSNLEKTAITVWDDYLDGVASVLPRACVYEGQRANQNQEPHVYVAGEWNIPSHCGSRLSVGVWSFNLTSVPTN